MKKYNQQTIDLFLKGELTDDAVARFLEELESNPDLKAEVMAQQELVEHLSNLGDHRLASLIREVHEEAMSKKRPFRKIKWLKIPLLVATFALLAIAVYLLNRPSKNIRLYQASYEVFDLSLSSRNSTIDEQKELAANYWHQKEYYKALAAFQKILSTDANDSKIRLATGICQMELNRFDEALLTFDYLIQKQDRLYFEHALWYSALVHLYQYDLDACKERLKWLINAPGTTFDSRAQTLLNELEKKLFLSSGYLFEDSDLLA